MTQLRAGGLVLYKRRPARVKTVSDGRLEVEADGGQLRKVRPKDVVALHPGPWQTVGGGASPDPVDDVDTVRELLVDEPPLPLAELAELIYGSATPAAVWAAWELVDDGLHFRGDVDAVSARDADEVAAEQARRAEADARAAAWEACLERVRAGSFAADDEPFLRQVEGLAQGRRDDARLLKALGQTESPEGAHALLLRIGRWTAVDLPHAARAGVPEAAPAVVVTEPDAGAADAAERLDLTGMRALAIDDAGNRDPDDAIGVDADGALWVHIADVAAWVPSGSPADDEARARGATLYRPQGAVPMLPVDLVPRLALGLSADGVGPALSFRLELSDDGEPTRVDVHPSRVRVERLSYDEAEANLESDADLRRLAALTDSARARRLAAGAIELDWPEVKLRVDLTGPGPTGDGPAIDLQPLPPLRSRQLVAEAMILTGHGVARWAQEHGLAVPFSVQDAGEAPADADADTAEVPTGLPAAYALRRRQKPARVTLEPGPHRGLGLEPYARATSPLRRYVDLIAHQQLRAAVTGGTPLDSAALLERVAPAETAAGAVRSVERQMNRHWTLVWLAQRDWRGRGVVVDVRGRRGLVVLPEIGLELWAPIGEGGVVGAEYEVGVHGVDLPRLEAHLELTPAS